MNEYVVEMKGIVKNFGQVQAVKQIVLLIMDIVDQD